MSSNPWINDEVPFEEYFAKARAKAYGEAEAEVARQLADPNAHIYTIDPAGMDHLGPANAEQRAEIRKSWRTWFWGVVRMYLTAAAIVATFGTVGVICMLLGAANSEVVLETFSEVLR